MADKSAGNITVRFSVQDQEVVRKALESLGKDGEAALRKINAAGQPVSPALKSVSNVVDELRSRLQGLAGSTGLVGTGLVGLGPTGLVAAAAIGALAYAFVTISEKVDAFVEKSKHLKEAAESTGLTLTQLKALGEVGSRVGLDFEQTEHFVERLTTAVQELRSKGAGPLFDALLKLDSGLVRQVAAAKDTADAVDIISAAYRRLDDQFKKNEFTKALAGQRGGVGGGRLLDAVADQGGVKQIEQDAIAAGKAVDEKLNASVVKLKNEIDRIKSQTDNIWGRMFAPEVLQLQKESAEFWLTIAQAMERASQARPQLEQNQATIFGRRFRGVDRPFVQPEPGSAQDSSLPADEFKLRNLGLSRLPSAEPDEGGVPVPRPRPSGAPQSLQVELSLMERWTAVLGAAITPAEALRQEQLKLAAAVDRGGVSQEVANRALGAFKLGQEQAAVAVKTRLGVASEAERLVLFEREYDALVAKYPELEAKRTEALALYRKELTHTIEQEKVRKSSAPQLTQLAIDASNLSKSLDQELTGALRGSTQDLIAMAKGTETLGEGLKNLASKFADAIVQAVLMKTVIGPIASGLSGLFGGSSVGGGFFGGSPATNPALVPSASGNVFDRGFKAFTSGDIGGSPATNPALVPSASGNVFDRGFKAFANGDIVTRPRLFAFAGGTGLMGEAGPEAIMPLGRDGSGRLGVRMAGGGGGGSVINQHFYLDGAMTKGDVVSMVKQGAAAAMQHTGASIKQYDAALPGRISDIQRDQF